MQWLIDIIAQKVIDTIGLPPTFIKRGDPPVPDFILGDFIIDGANHPLDLSSIIPSGAKAVLFHLWIRSDDAQSKCFFRPKGNVNYQDASWADTQVATIVFKNDLVCPLPSSRVLEYRFYVNGWTWISFVVKGWWL